MPKNLQYIGHFAFIYCNKLKQKEGYFKAFDIVDDKLVCRIDYTFEIGKSYHQDGKIEICKNGFHFCKRISDLFNHYHGKIDEDIAICEIEVSGDIDISEEGDKYCASDIKILRRLSREEIIDRLNNVEK